MTTIRICPMRDGPCPHGLDCRYVGDGPMGYPCKDGWRTSLATTPEDAIVEDVMREILRKWKAAAGAEGPPQMEWAELAARAALASPPAPVGETRDANERIASLRTLRDEYQARAITAETQVVKLEHRVLELEEEFAKSRRGLMPDYPPDYPGGFDGPTGAD